MEWPKLRSDLLFSRQGGEGEATFVVKDPVESQFFHLKEEEHFIAAQLDGGTPLETVRQRTEQKFNVALSPKSLANFVSSLRKSKLLEPGPSETGQRPKRGRLGGSLLYLRFKLFDPDALFTWLADRLRFCFRPGFLACTVAAIIWAFILAVANWGVLRQDLAQLVRWDALIWLCAAMFSVSTAHELAHGLTCKYFGGEVRELGFLLMYFQPALYCNVSDAWLFPEKGKRFWVGFAGPYFELFLWACAMLAWRLTDAKTALNYAALAIMTTSGLKTLVNFNPLIKLDGYYLLSDLLGVPNLRQRAYAYVGDAIKRLVGMSEAAPAELPRREKQIYLTYGLVSSVFSFSLLAFAIVKLGGFLSNVPQLGAALLAIGLLGLKVQRRFRRLFGKSSDSDDPDELPIPESPLGPNDSPEESRPVRQHKKLRGFSRRLVFVSAFLGLALPILFFSRMQLRISGAFVVLPIQNTDVRAEVDGTVEQVYVDEGDRVRAGDVIARLSDRNNRAALLKTKADIEQMQAQLRMLEAGPRPEEIELAKVSVVRAEDRLKFTQKNLERDRQLIQEHLLPQRDFEASQQAVVDSKNDLAEARQRLQLLLAGRRPEEIEAAKAGVARLETERHYLEEQLAQVKVTSPAAGIVATPSRVLKEMVGQLVKEGDLIAKVDEVNSVEVQTPVSEKDIADIKIGQTVALKARAYPEQTFFGTVASVGTTVQSGAGVAASGTSISPASNAASASAGNVLVTTRITNDALLLKPGMTGMLKITCDDRRLFELVTRRLARTIRVEFWSWW